MASIEPEALRVLSLDGGGIKGYTSLIILQRIFRTLQDIKPCDPPLKPCQVFDLIVGTSTGGLIAIMLGRLEMSIEEAINQYEVVGQKVFGQRPFFGKFANAIAGAPFYDIHILQECVKDVLKEKNIAPDEDFIVKDGIPSCRVKVCVTSKITSNVDALRSYRSVHPTIVNYDCTIWEAASATSAAPVFFKYVKFRTGDEFFDGGLRRNNPVEEALNECRQEKDLKDRELGCLISIGTGFHKIEGISSSLSRLLKAAVRMITDSQDTADRFLRSDEGLKLESSGRYFRFNVPQGMEDLRMDEHKETVRMRALTENYLHKMENGRMVAKCAEVLSKSDKLSYRHVSKLQEPNKYCTAAFFFSAKTDSEQSNLLHSPEGLYRSLLHQLLPHHEEGLRRVVEAYKEKLTGVSSYKGYAVSWPEEELRKLFQSLFDESFAPRTVIFVDAMDECDSNRVRELAFFFRGLANRANLKGRKLDVCFSSTRVAVVNLGNCPSIVVEENNELDILLYLEENFVCDGTNNPRDFISLKNKIAEISSGVFLWVVLVVDLLLEELDKGRNIKYLEDERLPEVPRRLQDLFRDILSRIKEEDREISLHFFQWAILAGELRLKEWRHIFPFIGCHKPLSFAKATQSKLYSKTDEQLEKQIRHVSMGLFEVVGKTGQASSEGTDIDHDSIIGDAGSLNSDIGDTRVVDAIHLSVREFFVREGGFQILSPGLGFNAIGKGYISIMDTCLDYIGIQEFDCLERARQGTTSSLSSSSDSLGGVCDREQFRQLKHVKVFRRPAAKFDGESDESLHPLEIKVQYITGKLTTQRSRTICRSDVPLVYLGDFYYLRPSG
ncbi:Calcium-independent phospholipase A2-gamma [Daldinia childiae]|uniref:Calcium-independent phospholipase A2-gamma n=1 Tax=Daldinia childiae TaxID=326645 RepID=UPI001445DB0A|nr:Calcium-independent phospholipase A2-gamma [Daldinia childiae]KAF3062292.1 Calcium-independent phospholipase A2-gamma [Daldinia childiae]